jgi:hypothetical protein
MTSSQFSPSVFFGSAKARRITPALVVFVVGLALASSAVAGPDDGDSGWTKPKPKATEKAPAKPATPPPAAGDKSKIKAEGKELFNQPAGAKADGVTGDATGWAVVLVAFRGDDREQLAAKALDKARTEGGLPEAYIARRRDAIIIAVGDFPSPDDERAKAELSRIQHLEINGARPFAGAMLAPPLDFKMTGSMPQFNLVKAKQLFGAQALYTLQIAAYGRRDIEHPTEKDLAEVRADAERAAAKLREEGEQAWYYHAPSMSLVCIGVFDQTDFDPQVPNFKSAKLRDAQKRHPYNLYNGAGIKEKRKGARDTLQPSNLVEIPKQ